MEGAFQVHKCTGEWEVCLKISALLTNYASLPESDFSLLEFYWVLSTSLSHLCGSYLVKSFKRRSKI